MTGLSASVIVVAFSVAVINDVLERQRRQRWSILAQYVMLDLVRNARLIWTGVLEHAGLLSSDAALPDSVEANGRFIRDSEQLTAALRDVIADHARLHGLQEEIALLAAHTDHVLRRWVAVMLNADLYVEVIDRHVELASEISWLEHLLDNSDPPEDHGRNRRALPSCSRMRRPTSPASTSRLPAAPCKERRRCRCAGGQGCDRGAGG